MTVATNLDYNSHIKNKLCVEKKFLYLGRQEYYIKYTYYGSLQFHRRIDSIQLITL